MTPPSTDPSRDTGSTLRLLTGVVLVISAATLALIGFVWLIRVLEAGGYGTPPMRRAFVVLGAAGAAFAGGIATLIWDLSKRYEHR